MSAVCVLVPIVIGSWPMIASAISGVATAMGFSVLAGVTGDVPERQTRKEDRTNRLELEVPNSDIVAESIGEGERMVIQRDNVTIEFGRDERGACTVCVNGTGLSKPELRAIGEEVAGRVVQQFAYNKLITELKKRNYELVREEVLDDHSIRVNIRYSR